MSPRLGMRREPFQVNGTSLSPGTFQSELSRCEAVCQDTIHAGKLSLYLTTSGPGVILSFITPNRRGGASACLRSAVSWAAGCSCVSAEEGKAPHVTATPPDAPPLEDDPPGAEPPSRRSYAHTHTHTPARVSTPHGIRCELITQECTVPVPPPHNDTLPVCDQLGAAAHRK
ncbi:hypothetical protein JZ751_009400 [Albula glossodonta]|uniref:Uncharacterized protein n=1 Tax=Albula glossodonta TaxID=121402 RepID=A0A8T2NBS8_9TELE|nr:hypothetical protein JZ751_009400 [Albula glossodonta]